MWEEKKPWFNVLEKIDGKFPKLQKYEHRWVKLEYKEDIYVHTLFQESVDAEISGFLGRVCGIRGNGYDPDWDFIYVKNPYTRYFKRIYVDKLVSIQIDYEMEKEFGRDRCEANRLRERFYILSLTREGDYL